MSQEQPPPSTASAGLAALMNRAREASGGRGLPPVERWEPAICGDIDMVIKADGSWHYMGSPIGREAMVRLFASVLRRDADGDTYLVTPVEKCRIRVEDAPFLGVEMDATGSGDDRVLTVRTPLGDVVQIGPAHPLRFAVDPATGGLKPYLHVRGRLEALLTRAVTHQLMDLAEERTVDGEVWLGVGSSGAFFPILRRDEAAA